MILLWFLQSSSAAEMQCASLSLCSPAPSYIIRDVLVVTASDAEYVRISSINLLVRVVELLVVGFFSLLPLAKNYFQHYAA